MFISLLSQCTDVFESIAGSISEITADKVKRKKIFDLYEGIVCRGIGIIHDACNLL